MRIERCSTDETRLSCRAGILAVLLLGGFVGPAASQAPMCTYHVVNTYPHDDQAFTQGLLYFNGELFESTGLYDESTLRRVELTTGSVLQVKRLASNYFAEGLALWQDRLLQLTWREETGFIWNAETLVSQGSFSYTGEGWGLTNDDRVLILSDGSSTLRHFDPDTYAEIGMVLVTDNGLPVDDLNELEWIRGEIFANRYLTDSIARIDPDTGGVIAWINLTGLLDPVPSGAGVLNGIAWDDAGERLFVTGKKWPSLFEIELVDCPELHLFGDGFESGATIRWSAVGP